MTAGVLLQGRTGLVAPRGSSDSGRAVRSLPISSATLEELLTSYLRMLRANNKSPLTLKSYAHSVRRLATWREANGLSVEVGRISRAEMEEYLAFCLTNRKPASVADWHGQLSTFFNWLVREGELAQSPLRGVKSPKQPDVPPPVLSDEQLRALLRACEGNDYYARRDGAIIRMLLDTGLRRAELAGITLDDLDLDVGEVTVRGKGSKVRTTAIHAKTIRALDRYLRVRMLQKAAATSRKLWIGHSGPMTGEGIYEVVQRRAAQAGIGHLWPHLFRHYFSHNFLAEGGTEGSLMRLNGWSDPKMVYRYGRQLASERARDELRKQKGGDKI